MSFFLYGESMGGAIALLIHLRQPELWQGVVLNGAMCGIGKFKPPWPAEHLLGFISGTLHLFEFFLCGLLMELASKEAFVYTVFCIGYRVMHES